MISNNSYGYTFYLNTFMKNGYMELFETPKIMNIPFNLRNGIKPDTVFDEKSLSKEVKIAISHLLLDLVNKNIFLKSIPSISILIKKLKQAGRILVNYQNYESEDQEINYYLDRMDWFRVFNFLERLYLKIECEKECFNYIDGNVYKDIGSIEDAKIYFSEEINYILQEESLPFEFVEGIFNRKGKFQTSKNLSNAYKVLVDPKFDSVVLHINLAKKAYEKYPESDYANTVKESICALEALVEILTQENASSNFNKALKKIVGNERGKIPIILSIIIEKIYAYRGDAKGVAHASLAGSKILENEAEFVLSFVASIITYLISVSNEKNEDLPF